MSKREAVINTVLAVLALLSYFAASAIESAPLIARAEAQSEESR